MIATKVQAAATCCAWANCCSGSPRSSPGGSGSASPSAGRSCAAQAVPVRRAAVEPRCRAAGVDARRAPRPAFAPQGDDRLRHPRSGRGDDDGRQDRAAARRPDRAARHAGAPYDTPASIVVAQFIDSPRMNLVPPHRCAAARASRCPTPSRSASARAEHFRRSPAAHHRHPGAQARRRACSRPHVRRLPFEIVLQGRRVKGPDTAVPSAWLCLDRLHASATTAATLLQRRRPCARFGHGTFDGPSNARGRRIQPGRNSRPAALGLEHHLVRVTWRQPTSPRAGGASAGPRRSLRRTHA